jgi:hypothetical protein
MDGPPLIRRPTARSAIRDPEPDHQDVYIRSDQGTTPPQARWKERPMKRAWLSIVPFLVLLAACEDQGNPGDDNLLTGGSLIVVLIIVAIAAYLFLRRRR